MPDLKLTGRSASLGCHRSARGWSTVDLSIRGRISSDMNAESQKPAVAAVTEPEKNAIIIGVLSLLKYVAVF